MKNNIYYIGFRESDIMDTNYFKGSITKYGSSVFPNISFMRYRSNPFSTSADLHDFFFKEMKTIIHDNPQCKFVFYDQKDAYSYDEDIFNHSIAFNNLDAINLFSDKFFCRQYFQNENYCPMSYILSKEQITLKNIYYLFPYSTSLVIQTNVGAGGNSTFIVKNKDDIEQYVRLFDNQYFLISNYIENAIPINVHVLVTIDDIVLFPASMQIIKDDHLFYGSNFGAMSDVAPEMKNKIKKVAYNIGTKIKKAECNGVFGIDFLISKNKLYFIEINFRFQGSSLLLNKYLISKGYKSLHEYHIDSFKKSIHLPNDLFFHKIPYMNYIVFNKNEPIPPEQKGQIILYDGYSPSMPVEENAYLYTIVYNLINDS